LTSLRDSCIIYTYTQLDLMYDDYEFNTFELDYTYDLDENHVHNIVHNTYELDDEYARDSTDYQTLAYMHYA